MEPREALHPHERRLSVYTNAELEAFARATALPHAREQVVETLTLGLCLSTQACTTADVRGGEQLSLSPLRTVVKEAEEAVTPMIILKATKFWQETGVPVGAVGGWAVLMFLAIQMARWTAMTTRAKVASLWRKCWEPVQVLQEPERRCQDVERSEPSLYPLSQLQVEGVKGGVAGV